jgi:hypothetical protein
MITSILACHSMFPPYQEGVIEPGRDRTSFADTSNRRPKLTDKEQPAAAQAEVEEGAIGVRLRVRRVEAKIRMYRHHLPCRAITKQEKRPQRGLLAVCGGGVMGMLEGGKLGSEANTWNHQVFPIVLKTSGQVIKSSSPRENTAPPPQRDTNRPSPEGRKVLSRKGSSPIGRGDPLKGKGGEGATLRTVTVRDGGDKD